MGSLLGPPLRSLIHVPFLLGTQHQIGVSDLVNILYPKGWHSILQSVFSKLALLLLLSKDITVLCEADSLWLQYVIQPMNLSTFQHLLQCEVDPLVR